jgi:hypothetical protein
MTLLFNNTTMIKTSIQVEKSTRDMLRDKGKKSESYDDIILRMMTAVEECEKRHE